MSPRSSVQTERPCMPARLSEKPIACALNPTAGRCDPVSSTDPVSSKMAARSLGPRRSVRRVPAAVHVPSNACHPPAGGLCGAVPPDWPHAAVSSTATSSGQRHPWKHNACGREIIFLSPRKASRISIRTLVPWSLSWRLNRRRITVLIRPAAVALLDQLVERLSDGEHLILAHARAWERRHATDRGDAFGLGLEHHQVERLLAMAARAASHQQGSGDALELTRRNIGARMVLHALNRALNLRWFHRNGHAQAAGAVTLYAVLHQNLANSQRPQHGDIVFASQIRRQARDALLKLAHLHYQRDGENKIDEHDQHHDDAKSGEPPWLFGGHFTILLPRRAMRPPVELQDGVLSPAPAALHGLAGCAPASRTQTEPLQ